MKVKDIIRKQTTVVALAIVLVSLAIVGVSYAIFFDIKANAKNQIITAGTLKLTITDIEQLSNVNGDSLVMINSVGLTSQPIKYTVKNTDSNLPATYSLYLDVDTTDSNLLNYITISTDGTSYFKMLESETIEDDEGKIYYKLESNILEAGASGSTNELRIWLDEDIITNDIKNTSLTINLYIITEVAEIDTQAKEYILAGKTIEQRTDFSTTVTADTTGKIYSENTSLGTTYYYAGAPNDNYVKFAGFYWRIIRINENGSLRMIYAGDASVIDALPNKEEVLANGYNDSVNDVPYTQIGASKFNTHSASAEYVGFKYELGYVHGTETKSIILEYLEKWYNKNLTNYKTDDEGNFINENNVQTTNPIIDSSKTDYSLHIDNDAGFCGDRSLRSGSGIGTTETYYGAYDRIVNKYGPTMECSDSNDLYKTKIGLITADEVIYAGGIGHDSNYRYYLYTGNWYWTLSPYGFSSGPKATVYSVIDGGLLDFEPVDYPYSGVRPVINITVNNLAGSGTITDPYYIT